MANDKTDNNEHRIASFEALKTAIANNETSLVKDLVAGQTMQKLEKDYLLELARLGNNPQIVRLLQEVPLRE